jgi:RNA polymerase sigma-70 factor (ECF subfamily)
MLGTSGMNTPSPAEVTQLLHAWSEGDRSALDQLMPIVHNELHRLAHRYMGRERAGHMLQTTALINEVYVKLVGEREMKWQNRTQFFGVAATLMRQILVDYARARRYAKRGGGAQEVTMDEAWVVSTERSAELVALDDALNELAVFDERKGRIAELRFFAGLSVEETAEVLGVAPVTVMRDWRLAKAWLHRELAKN